MRRSHSLAVFHPAGSSINLGRDVDPQAKEAPTETLAIDLQDWRWPTWTSEEAANAELVADSCSC